MNVDCIKEMNVDVALSFGPTCRAAEALRRNKLRYFSNPLDWMMRYSLDDVFDILKNKGKDFGSDFEQQGEDYRKRYRFMVSKSTGMVDIHHFRKNVPVKDAYELFRYSMDKRFKEMDEILSNAKTVLILTSRLSDTENIKTFINNLITLYDFEKIYFININDNPEEKIVTTEYDNVIIYECFFKDEHPNGSNPDKNRKFWKGNMEAWDAILSKVKINKKFRYKYSVKKIFDKLFCSNLKIIIKSMIIKIGITSGR